MMVVGCALGDELLSKLFVFDLNDIFRISI
jgi:hypothetical protein